MSESVFMVLFQLSFSNNFTLLSFYFLPFTIHNTHQDQGKDNLFHKTVDLLGSLHEAYAGKSPDIRLWQSLLQLISHLIRGGICFSRFNTTVSVMSIVDTSNLLAFVLSQKDSA